MCWDTQPNKRPTFALVQRELRELLYESIIRDRVGRQFWTKAGLGERAHWKQFVSMFVSYFKLDEPDLQNDPVWTAAHYVLCDQDDTVHLDVYARVCALFGPMSERGMPLINNIADVVLKGYFWTELSAFQAETFLRKACERKPNSYLVRYSMEKEAFVLSCHVQGVTRHYTMSRADSGPGYQLSRQSPVAPTLPHLVERLVGELSLGSPQPIKGHRLERVLRSLPR